MNVFVKEIGIFFFFFLNMYEIFLFSFFFKLELRFPRFDSFVKIAGIRKR